MWRLLFLGFISIAFGETVSDEQRVEKRQVPYDRSNVVYGSPPGHFLIPVPNRAGHVPQAATEYPTQSELFASRKAPGAPYQIEGRQPPQYVKAVPVQAGPLVHQGQVYYRPRAQAAEPPQPAPVQYAASAILDSKAGAFERELAQLVAANQAQEHRYKPAPPRLPVPVPQQYLKEVSKPAARPGPRPILYQQAPQHYAQKETPQPAPLFRFVYQHEQPQQNAQYYQDEPESKYIQQIPQYQQQHGPLPGDLRQELEPVPGEPSVGPAITNVQKSISAYTSHSEDAPPGVHRVQQGAPKKAPSPFYPLAPIVHRHQEKAEQQAPLLGAEIPPSRTLSQEEFQNLLKIGGYTATLLPSDNSSATHQEYLLHPPRSRFVLQDRPYLANKQEPVPYIQQQQAIKRKPAYSVPQL